jgi:acyl-CoA reductase-like NAD-dependent aldehyde dehydrogenase
MFNLKYAHSIRNRFVVNSPGRQFEKRSPVDGSLVGMVPEAAAPEVNAAVEAAQGALLGPWRRLTMAQRVNLLEAEHRDRPPDQHPTSGESAALLPHGSR